MRTPSSALDVNAILDSAEPFDSAGYLQRHLTSSSVAVSALHPVMRDRLAFAFIELTKIGLASDTPGQGVYQILSGVRSRSHQEALWRDICLRQGRCSMVANPYTVHGVDVEGVQRVGSNHQAQTMPTRWARFEGVDELAFGYAVDIRTSGSWTGLHSRLPRFGLDWPLKGSPYEPWHVEAFPRSAGGWLDGEYAWRRPGMSRPIMLGMIGGDVRKLQRRLGITVDGVTGPGTVAEIRAEERRLRRPVDGIWSVEDEQAFEKRRRKPRPDKPSKPEPAPVPSKPEPDPVPIVLPPGPMIDSLSGRLLDRVRPLAKDASLPTDARRAAIEIRSLAVQIRQIARKIPNE